MKRIASFSEDMPFNFASATEFETFKHFSDTNGFPLNIRSFKNLLSDLLTDASDSSKLKVNELFTTFDENKDDVIDADEFVNVWNNFIQPLVKPVTALLVIDVQNDFIDGSLALKNCSAKQDGNDVIPVINNLLDRYNFDVVAYSYDYHPKDHISFIDNVNLYKLREKNKSLEDISIFDTVIFEGPPEINQKLWPTHCVQNTWGSQLHKDLKIVNNALHMHKGTNSCVDSYSAFFDNLKLSKTSLDAELKQRNVTHVFICGLAFDYCVSYTALDAVELGYATAVVKDAARGTEEGTIKCMEDKLKSLNCVLVDACEVEHLIQGKDIRIEFASTLQSMLKSKCSK